jgi:hypothetical protein
MDATTRRAVTATRRAWARAYANDLPTPGDRFMADLGARMDRERARVLVA